MSARDRAYIASSETQKDQLKPVSSLQPKKVTFALIASEPRLHEPQVLVRRTTDWENPDWDDLDAVQVLALERRAYLDTVLAARVLGTVA